GVFATGMNAPHDLEFDASGNLYVANQGSNTISKITPGGVVSTFASGGLLSAPSGLAFDASGNLYVSNLGGNTIEVFTPGGVGTIFANNGVNGAVLSAPFGLA